MFETLHGRHARPPLLGVQSRQRVRSFALGLFIAFIPPTPLPVHLVACTLLGVYFRLNLPVLIATVFISNPFTWVPQVAGSLWVGSKLLGLGSDAVPARHQPPHALGGNAALWPPLLLGALVLGLIAAACGYVLAQAAWRARVIYQLRRRRARSSERSIALD